MSDSLDLHRRAMVIADDAQVALDDGRRDEAQDLFRRAAALEEEAATGVGEGPPLDRAVLLRSAAALALEGAQPEVAERLLARGLLQDVPNAILDEMRDLLEQVHFQRHLDIKGITLDDTDVQMSMAGQAIGYGFASSDEFVTRVRDFERLLYRTAERKAGREYREGGSPKKFIKNNFELYLSVPRAASFAVTLRLGRPKDQLAMSEVEGQPSVIAETLDLLEIAQSGDLAAIQERVPQEPYRRNLLALAKKIAPDGDNVSIVGFTVRRGVKERRLSLTRTKPELNELTRPRVTPAPSERVEVTGLLKFADDTGKGEGTIKLVESDGTTHKIRVPEGMMTDIVRPLWDDEVVVRGERSGGVIELDEIDAVDE